MNDIKEMELVVDADGTKRLVRKKQKLKLRDAQEPAMQYRSVTFSTESGAKFDDDALTIRDVTASSEEPYERSFGMEVLSHKDGALDMRRLTGSAAPLLYNHERGQLLGKPRNARIAGGKLATDFQFSKSPQGRQAYQDAKDGILTECSIGYSIDEWTVQEREDADIYTATKWAIHEISLVTVPADYSVGVGRSAELNATSLQKTIDEPNHLVQRQTIQTMVTETAPVQEPKINVVEERNAAVAAERKRVADITELSRHFASNGLGGRKIDTTEIAEQFVREGKNVDEFQAAVVRGNFKEVVPVSTKPVIGMDKKDLENYSILRAMNRLGSKQPLDGFEKECSDSAAKLLRQDTSGFFIPHDVMGHRSERALATNVFSAAGALVGTNLMAGSMIDLLRNNMVVVQMGARTMSGLQGNLAIPKVTGGATAYWLSEDGTVTASSQTVGQISLTPHRLAAKTAFTLQLLAQSSVDVENFVREDLMKVLALKKDLAALVGTGTAGEPLGITNIPAAQRSTPVTLANAGTITYAEAVRFETNLANANALIGSPGFVTTPTVKGGTKVTPKFSNTGTPVWENDMVNGYRAMASLQNTAANTVIFGDWSSIIIGDWAGTEVLVDPYTLGSQGQVQIIIQQLTDIICRQPKSFAISSN